MRKLTADWQRPTDCGSGTCVEVRREGELIAVRNSNSPTTGVTRYTEDEWKAFIEGAKEGEFEL